MLETMVAGVALVAIVAYGVLAGADFGGGIWDLFASGVRKADQRRAISFAMAPVWEANHVWLIFVIVILFGAFPPAFAALSIGLFAPFHMALIGITLRGTAFVFRAYGPQKTRIVERWSAVFGASSVVTPVLLGVSMGTVSSGEMRVVSGDVPAHAAWFSPVPMAMGTLALALCAYLAAVFLTNETKGALREDFRRRALSSGTVVVALSVVTIPLVAVSAPHLFEGLLSLRALPVLTLGTISALTSGYSLWRRHFRVARVASVVQIALLIAGWGVAQYPYILYPDFTIFNAAAPPPTLRFFLYSLVPGALLLGPSLWLLFRVFKRDGAQNDELH